GFQPQVGGVNKPEIGHISRRTADRRRIGRQTRKFRRRSCFGGPPLLVKGLKLAVERLNAAALYAEAVARGALQQYVEAESFVTASQGEPEAGVGYIGPPDDGAVVIVDHAIIIEVFVAQISGLYFIASGGLRTLCY